MIPKYSPTDKTSRIWWVVFLIFLFLLIANLPVGQRLGMAMGPLLKVLQAPVMWAENLSLWMEDAEALQKRYQTLQAEFDEQHALAQEVSALKTENRNLRKLLNITAVQDFEWLAARVVSRGQELKSRRLMLNTSEVAADDIVVSHEGLVGIIDQSNKSYAVVRTILDASLAVPVTMKESHLAALVRGDGEQLLVDFVPLKTAPKVGDLLLTSGAGGLFPAGLPVAKVTDVQAVEGGLFAEVAATPVANWKKEAWLAVAKRSQH